MAEPTLDVSVILATYRQLYPTTLALQALFAQQTACRYEVIVCDDGSDAETIGALRDLLQAAPVPAYLAWQQDQGFRAAASRNNGIHLARGRILIFLDGDLVPEADFVESHLRAHEHAQLIAVGKRLWRNPEALAGEAIEPEALWALLRSEESMDRLSRGVEAMEELGLHVRRNSAPWKACRGCNFSVSNSSLVEFDESFVGWGLEDLDLGYGLTVLHGYELALIDAAAYDVQGWVDTRETWKQSDYIAHLCNGFRFIDKWAHTGITAQEILPRHNLDPETDLWRHTPLRERPRATPVDDTAIRQWLTERGFLPPASGGEERA